MAKPSQRDLARSGPRGGVSGGVSSGGLGGSDRPDERDRREGPESGSDPRTRPRTAGIFGGNDGETEPTKEKGFLERANEFLQQPQEPSATLRERRQAELTRREGDERPPVRPRSPEEEEVIVPGDPSNLGARGRRRRTEDQVSQPPLLRRGLLGV